MSNTMIIASMIFVGAVFLGYNLFAGNRETTISDTIIGVALWLIALSIIETILKFVLIILGKSTSGINPYVNFGMWIYSSPTGAECKLKYSRTYDSSS